MSLSIKRGCTTTVNIPSCLLVAAEFITGESTAAASGGEGPFPPAMTSYLPTGVTSSHGGT